VLVGELRDLLLTADPTSTVFVFVKLPGALQPHVVEIVETTDLSTDDAFVLYVDVPDMPERST
jgi:hypothetical protein